jgi:anti-anti-sigma regulatory factor
MIQHLIGPLVRATSVLTPLPSPSPGCSTPQRKPGEVHAADAWRGRLALAPPRQRWLEVEQLGDVAVVTFRQRQILTAGVLEAVGTELNSLVDEGGQRHLILNFGNIDRLTSGLFAKLLILHQKVRAVQGRLVFCRIAPHLREIFALFKLHLILGIYAEEQEALQAFHRGGPRDTPPSRWPPWRSTRPPGRNQHAA